MGRREDALEVPSPATLDTVFSHYERTFPRLAVLRPSIVFARNQHFSAASAPVEDGDEVAFLPPVSGGSGPYLHEKTDDRGNFFAITRDPIDAGELRQRILDGSDGAIVLFEGVVRNNTKGRATRFLDYEGYEPMALEAMARIGREIASQYQVGRIAMVHRLGLMQIGEASVMIAVAAPHRRPAFEAALEGINRLKKTVPIWKKEHFEDGEVWVEGDWDPDLLAR